MSQLPIDPIVFADFLQQYKLNSPPKRIELEKLLKNAVDSEVKDLPEEDRQDVLVECETLITTAKSRLKV